MRILVKRTRYLTEAFPKTSPLSRKAYPSGQVTFQAPQSQDMVCT
ncbi:CHAD domain-containing protein [Pseudomonas sp. F01002]|nr:CHAD domain-containing protein [Pseudomonas sp. F01002]